MNPDIRIPVVMSGIMGDPEAMKIMTGNPDLVTRQVTLQGYGLRIQALEHTKLDHVRNKMIENWGEKDYPGAMTVVKAEGECAQATYASLTPAEWLTFNSRGWFWNFHGDYFGEFGPKEGPNDGWYKPARIPIEACPVLEDDLDVPALLTEVLVDTENLQPLPENFDTEIYPKFREKMLGQLRSESEWRNPELDFEAKRVHASRFKER